MSAVVVEDGPDIGAIWHFGDPYKEERLLEEGLGWADLSHQEIVSISGQDRLIWLHALTTQFLENLPVNTWTSALILDPQGHIEHQFNVVDDGTTTWLTLDAGRAGSLIEHLLKMKFMMRVDVQDVSDKYSLLRIPGISDEMGGPFSIILKSELEDWRNRFENTSMQVGTWALDAQRVAARRPRIGFEMDHKSIPNELGLLNKSVHMNKGCYRGQETVAKIFNLGAPPRRLTLLHLDGSVVSIPNVGADVENDGIKVGYVGTTARHYELGTIALAVVKRNTPADALLMVEGIPASQEN